MLKRIKDFFAEMLYAPIGALLLVFAIMLMLSIFNLINTTLLFSSNTWMLPMIALAFLVPYFIFRAFRGGKKYLPAQHLETPKRYHIPIILLSTGLILLGSMLIKILLIKGKYVEFPLYSAFFANRNGSVFNDIYLALVFCLIPPIFEGLIFRGVLIKEFYRRGFLCAVLCSSIFFSLLGFSFFELLPRFFLGIMLCIVIYATESLAITITMHIAYNLFATFFEPTFISLKNISANTDLFIFITTIITLIIGIFLFSHLSRLYRKYSHTKFGENFVKSTSIERTFWHLVELMLSIPAIACYVLFMIVTLIMYA